MKRPLALAAVTVLFLAGIGAGILATHLFYAHHLRPPAGGPLGFMGRPFLQHLDDRLELSEEQSRKIRDILRQSRRDGERIRQQIRPQIESLAEETHKKIHEILTPEQRTAFEDMRPFRRGGSRGPHRTRGERGTQDGTWEREGGQRGHRMRPHPDRRPPRRGHPEGPPEPRLEELPERPFEEGH